MYSTYFMRTSDLKDFGAPQQTLRTCECGKYNAGLKMEVRTGL